MRKALLLIPAFLLVACVDTTGISSESNRPPKGNPSSTVLVEEFADLQCPACKAALDQVTNPILEKYGNSIRFEFRHFPLRSIHPFALEAAEAAECAADQDAFWEYHDLVYAEQSALSSDALRKWAGDLDLDTELLDRCIKSKLKREPVIADFQEGRDRGVTGTPTFFVNGEKVQSTVADISAAIDRVLGQRDLQL